MRLDGGEKTWMTTLHKPVPSELHAVFNGCRLFRRVETHRKQQWDVIICWLDTFGGKVPCPPQKKISILCISLTVTTV